MNRAQTITTILENMALVKRALGGHFQSIIADVPLSPGQLELLHVIQRQQPTTSKALAENRQLTAGAVSQLIDMIETEGFIVREQAASDRRLQHIRLTDTGEKLVSDIHKRRDKLFRKVMRDFTDEELTAWLKVQQRIIETLEAHKPERT